jgi:hypothetical protein
MRKIKLKIISINMFIIISVYIISFFFKPNLNLQTIYKFEKISINTKINFLPSHTQTDIEEKKSLLPSELLFKKFMTKLTYQNIKKPLEDCPNEVVLENFRTVHIYDVNESNFSVDININSSPENVQKCFNKIFISELNKFYQNIINERKNKFEYYITIQSNLYSANNKTNVDAPIFDNPWALNQMQTIESWKKHLQEVNFFVYPNKEYKPIIKKNEINFIIIYLSLIFFFLFFQIIYYLIKNKKLLNKLLEFKF